MNTHEVIRRLPGPDGKHIEPGTAVDASEWRNAPLLVEQRYLKPLDGVEAPIDLPPNELNDLRGQVTEILLQDIRERGPIMLALQDIVLSARSAENKTGATARAKQK